MVKKVTILIVFLEVSIFAAIAALSICMRKFMKPFTRGFFRDDQSIMHPFHSSTISSAVLYCVGFIVPGAVMILTEGIYAKYMHKRKKRKLVFNMFLWNTYHVVGLFMFGAAVTHLLTNIPKYTIGRLRPHFMSVCKPDWSKLTSNDSYIVQDICTGPDTSLIMEARVSFPSGHSSMSMYCAVILMLYLEKRLNCKNFMLVRPTLQLAAFSMAFFTCLSRISDYKHHWSDVLAGAILGMAIAYVIMVRMTQVVFHKRTSRDASSSMEFPNPCYHYSSSPIPTVISTDF
ncbi:lipid phosphate phosphohydrolase 1 [Biomphalaria pfeifferi]|uniref:Lipid phosphate phosphohydrolase 1 n=1 Tax=Biomphalaria pfeifferi TaxID=112525 RepID=A0AAD8BHL5_BIOPF|nr:lipid phosphate phosphohydrolase 1 [Biomphalaria pfeifferi]